MDKDLLYYYSPIQDRYRVFDILKIWSKKQYISNHVLVWTFMHNLLVSKIYPEQHAKKRLLISTPLDNMSDVHWKILIAKIKDREINTKHETVAILTEVLKLDDWDLPPLFHVGMTSSDVQDQAILMQQVDSYLVLGRTVEALLHLLKERAKNGHFWQTLVGRTHLQPAEPTTLLHRINLFVQDLKMWHDTAVELAGKILPNYKGVITGSVGTGANLAALVYQLQPLDHGIPTSTKQLKSQTLPRSLDLLIAQNLSFLASILYKFSLDFRLESGMQNVYEIESTNRIGSSAMPYKRNPITAEKVCSLTRYIHHLTDTAWDNASEQMLERSLDDSANRRMWLPESFNLITYAVMATMSLVQDLTTTTNIEPCQWFDVWSKSLQKSMDELHAYMQLTGGADIPLKANDRINYLAPIRSVDFIYIHNMDHTYTSTFTKMKNAVTEYYKDGIHD